MWNYENRMVLSIIEKSKGIWKNNNSSTLFYYLVILILIGLILSNILGAILCQIIFGINFFFTSPKIFDPTNIDLINAMKFMQFINAVGTFILPPIILIHFRGLDISSYLKLHIPNSFKSLFFIFIMSIAMIPLANFFGVLNEYLPLPEFLNFLKLYDHFF